MEDNKQEGKTELEYRVAPIWRRFVAMLIDLFFIVLVGFLVFGLSNMALNETEWFKGVAAQRSAIQEESGLYIDGKSLSEYYRADGALSTREKKDLLAEALGEFYLNPDFCDQEALEGYDDRKEGAVEGVTFLFVEDENGNLVENDVNPQYLFDFYCDELDFHALGYLASNPVYAETTRFYFWSSFIQISVSMTLSVTVFWLVLPLTAWKRGRMTIGRKMMGVALLYRNALTPSVGQYLLRFLFIYFVYLWLGLFSFLLPEIVSVAMQMFGKRQQDLAEYVLNQYSVDARGRDIYLDYGDYLVYKDRKGRASLFNPNIKEK